MWTRGNYEILSEWHTLAVLLSILLKVWWIFDTDAGFKVSLLIGIPKLTDNDTDAETNSRLAD